MLLYKYCGPSGIAILQNDSIWLTQPRAFNDPFDVNPHVETIVTVKIPGDRPARMIPELRVVQKRFALKTNSTVVLSLTKTRESLLMWAHYAAHHTGLVIGFETDGGILRSPSQHRVLGDVVYAPARPSGPTEADLSDEQVWLTKGEEWTYEEEWRIIDSLFSADGEGPAHRWPFNIRPESVRQVVLGCRSDSVTEQEVVQALMRDELRHVALFKAVPDERRFGLNFIEESPPGSRVVVLP